jgi:hypothetical protein
MQAIPDERLCGAEQWCVRAIINIREGGRSRTKIRRSVCRVICLTWALFYFDTLNIRVR